MLWSVVLKCSGICSDDTSLFFSSLLVHKEMQAVRLSWGRWRTCVTALFFVDKSVVKIGLTC